MLQSLTDKLDVLDTLTTDAFTTDTVKKMYQQCKDAIPRLFKLAHSGVESAKDVKLRIESLITRVESHSKGTINLLDNDPVTVLIDPFDHIPQSSDTASYGMNYELIILFCRPILTEL